MKKDGFSTNDVCEFFNISKSTLFRWEKEARIGPIKRSAGERVYLNADLSKIIQLKLAALYEKAARLDNAEEIHEIDYKKSLYKIFCGNKIGLDELREYNYKKKEFPPDDIKLLLKFTIDRYNPNEPYFVQVIDLVSKMCRAATP